MKLFGKYIAIILGACLISTRLFAETFVDPYYGFSLTSPPGWTTQSLREGTDSVIRYTSPDEAAYGEMRAFHLAEPISVELLVDAFEKQAAEGATRAGIDDETLDGLAGKVVAWRFEATDPPIVLATFFTVDGPVGYMFIIVVPEPMLSAFMPTFDGVFETFKRGHLVSEYLGAGQVEDGPESPQQPDLFDGLVAEPHPELGFVFVRYDDWEVDQPEPWQLRVGKSSYAPNLRPSIVVEVLSGNAYDTVEHAAADLKDQLRGMDQITFDQDGPHMVPNMAEDGQMMEGWSFGASYMRNGVPFRQIMFMFRRKQPDVYYGIYITGPQEAVNTHQPEMMRMLQAIQIVPFSQ